MRAILLLGLIGSALAAAPNAKLNCVTCHPAQAAHYGSTGMAQALSTGAHGEILKSHPKLTFQQGPYSYSIEREGDQSWYRVSDGKQEMRVPVAWAFGLGAAGQTYVFERNGGWYESRVSFYKDIGGLDLTTGARRDVPANFEEAIGRQQSAEGAGECFNCHSTGALENNALRVRDLTPGVQCQRCHEGSRAHLAGFQQPGAAKSLPPKLSALDTEELSNFCGQCHRTWAQIASQGPHGVANVRFQPYRLANSKCYNAADARIACIACHDVHNEVVKQASFYDSRCTACHSNAAHAAAKLCKVSTKDCATCHMPKIEIKETHNLFTDHWIRVVRAKEPYPD